MKKNVLQPWNTSFVSVTIHTLEEISLCEIEEISSAILRAFSWTHAEDPWPTFHEIRLAISEDNSILANKLIDCKYTFCY